MQTESQLLWDLVYYYCGAYDLDRVDGQVGHIWVRELGCGQQQGPGVRRLLGVGTCVRGACGFLGLAV